MNQLEVNIPRAYGTRYRRVSLIYFLNVRMFLCLIYSSLSVSRPTEISVRFLFKFTPHYCLNYNISKRYAKNSTMYVKVGISIFISIPFLETDDRRALTCGGRIYSWLFIAVIYSYILALFDTSCKLNRLAVT